MWHGPPCGDSCPISGVPLSAGPVLAPVRCRFRLAPILWSTRRFWRRRPEPMGGDTSGSASSQRRVRCDGAFDGRVRPADAGGILLAPFGILVSAVRFRRGRLSCGCAAIWRRWFVSISSAGATSSFPPVHRRRLSWGATVREGKTVAIRIRSLAGSDLVLWPHFEGPWRVNGGAPREEAVCRASTRPGETLELSAVL